MDNALTDHAEAKFNTLLEPYPHEQLKTYHVAQEIY